MKSVRSRSSTRSISRRPRGSNRHSSTRSAFLEKSAKFTPAPSHVAPSGCARPRQTVLRATTDRAGASTEAAAYAGMASAALHGDRGRGMARPEDAEQPLALGHDFLGVLRGAVGEGAVVVLQARFEAAAAVDVFL